MIVLFFGMLILLLLVASIVVPVGSLGKFERARRQKLEGGIEVERELYYPDVVSLQRALTALLLAIVTAASVASFGWIAGVIIALLVAIEYGAVSRLAFLRRFTTTQYGRIEKKLLGFIKAYPVIFRFVGYFTPEAPEVELHSRAELQHLIELSHGVFSHEEKTRLIAGITFTDKRVEEVMTPRSVIDAVGKDEILGPLVLDDLHKTGHSRIPVIEGDVDHVIGMLYLRDILTLDTTRKKSVSVQDVMDKSVYYIHEGQSLSHALAAFIKTHHHLFVVVNEYRETVGLLSLEDVTETLLGAKIVDEYDFHDDLRAVATRNPRGNNRATTSAKDI